MQKFIVKDGTPITRWPADSTIEFRVAACVVDVPADGATVNVVGTNSYQGTLTIAGGGKTIDGCVNRDHIALLIPEPTNPYDVNAVRVFLQQGGLTGYLSRGDAVAYRPAIDVLAARGQVLGARASLVGGWDRGKGDRGSIGIRLFMGTPDQVLAEIGWVPATPEGWHPDQRRRHELRWWDGSRWTDHVADAGVVSTDPVDVE